MNNLGVRIQRLEGPWSIWLILQKDLVKIRRIWSGGQFFLTGNSAGGLGQYLQNGT
jgi:hypothetical protein